jgi:hypothetical protein
MLHFVFCSEIFSKQIIFMKTGAIKVCRRQDVSKSYFNVELETWSF